MAFQSGLTELSDLKRLSSIDIQHLFAELSASATGLNTDQAHQRQREYGQNTILASYHETVVAKFLKLFLSPLSLLLMFLALISYLTGEPTDALVILSIILLSTGLTALQEHKSNGAAKKLRSLVTCKTNVLRDAQSLEIDFSEVVPGDVVLLSAGSIIPADLRVIESKDLFVNESALSGESLPSEKSKQMPDLTRVDSAFDLKNICFMGSHVVSGTAKCVVLTIGEGTFFGEVAKETINQKKVSSFDQGIKHFSWLMIRFMLVMAPAVFLINGILKGNWIEAGLFAIALSIGLAPEMLPMLVTVNLAKGAIIMSKRRVIVKRLNAIQNLGAMDILCTDKTGTLTQDQIILERYLDVSGQENDRVLEFAYLNSHYQSGLQNPLDVAILQYTDVHKKLHDADTYQKIDEIPFDFERRRMSVVVQKSETSQILICKGAVEEVIHCCRYAQIGEALVSLSASHQENLDKVVAGLNHEGFRVVAVAVKEESVRHHAYGIEDESDLVLLGYIAFLDPPKDSAGEAIQKLNRLGVQVKILTGDNELVTRKICQEVNLPINQVLLGSQIDSMSDDALMGMLGEISVFAKMTPQQKARVIRLLQQRGHVVGYMGDGINDGPGLKIADVSISVDTGVDIAKETADIILLEKSLMILQEGVIEGRRVFGNIMKYLKMSASSTFGNVLSMVGASAFLPFLPMLPQHVLLNDLLYDCSQTSVPTDSVDDEYLAKPRAWDISGIERYMLTIGPISSLFDYITFAFLWYGLKANSIELSGLFQTGWFVESLLSQTLIVHVIRTGRIPFIQSKPSPFLLITTIGICLLGALLPYTDLGAELQLQPLPTLYWYGTALIIPAYLLATQLIKRTLIRRFGLI